MQSSLDSQNNPYKSLPHFTTPHNNCAPGTPGYKTTTYHSLPAALAKLKTSSPSWATIRAMQIKMGLQRLAPSKLVAYAAHECGAILIDSNDTFYKNEGFLLLTDVLAGRYGPQAPLLRRYRCIILSGYYVSQKRYDLAEALLVGVAREIQDKAVPLMKVYYHQACCDLYEHMGNDALAWRHAQSCYEQARLARGLRTPKDKTYARETRRLYFNAAERWEELWPPHFPARFLNWNVGSTRTRLLRELMEYAREKHGETSFHYQSGCIAYIASLCAHEFRTEALTHARIHLKACTLNKEGFGFYALSTLIVFIHLLNHQADKAITYLKEFSAPLDSNNKLFIQIFESVEQALIEEQVRAPSNLGHSKRRFNDALALMRRAFSEESEAKKVRLRQRIKAYKALKKKKD